MKTYQDLMAAQDRGAFILEAVSEHKSGIKCRKAQSAGKYYDGENPKIMNYYKVLYDLEGRAHKDVISANHKIASNIFRLVVDQEVRYLLDKGIRFEKDDTAARLGRDFTRRAAQWLTAAKIGGISFGFWNLDHLEVFQLAEDEAAPGFVPLWDEEDGSLKAGIRYWRLDEDRPLKATLYELDGYTPFAQRKGEPVCQVGEQQPYIRVLRRSVVDGIRVEPGEKYPFLPIIPLKNNPKCQSEIEGKRNTVDALDLVTSGMVNNIDEGNLIYWVLTNCDGMDDIDDAEFLRRLRTTHVAHAEGDGAKAEPQKLEAPYAATESGIRALKERLREDFMYFDPAAVMTAGNQTATGIAASYTLLDQKAGRTKDQLSDAIGQLLKLLGIDDAPVYQVSPLINKAEEMETILMGADHYSEEYTLKKMLSINGDLDQYEEIAAQKIAEDADRMTVLLPKGEGEEE